MNTKRGFSSLGLAILAAVCLPNLAQAHIIPGEPPGFAHGFQHPLHGLDHILAMVAVGLWAVHLGGRALWAVPSTFVGMMVVGGALGMAGVPVPFVETGILVSVFFLGALLLTAARLPLWGGMTLVALFALMHGHAHGAEMPDSASGWAYGAGFALATILLHLSGIGLGLCFQQLSRLPLMVRIPLLRISGAMVIAGGCYLLIQ